MRETFDVCHPWLLIHEGGYVDHPDDPGGATNQGITRATWQAFLRRTGQPYRSLRDMRPDERDAIYRRQYWEKVAGDELPAGLDYALYDFAVHSGPARAVSFIQAIVGVDTDGVMGMITLAAIRSRANVAGMIAALCRARMAFLRRLKHWPTFKTGWTRRVMGEIDGAQDGDSGTIDRAIILSAPELYDAPPPPAARDDGAGAKGAGPERVLTTIRDMLEDAGGLTALVGTGGLAALTGSDDPVIVLGTLALAAAVLLGLFVIVRRKSHV